MLVDEMLGSYLRLRQELADACSAPRPNEPYLKRLRTDISRLERALADSQPVDEQTSEMWLPIVNSSLGATRRDE